MGPPRTASLLQIRAAQNPRVDPVRLARLSAADRELWRRIGSGASVRELARGAGADAVLAQLRTLQAMGAIVLEREAADEDDIPIVDETELGELAPAEARLLAEDVDLEPWEKRRILAVRRSVARGSYYELLRLPRTASKRELKRAYFALSKDYHPDRYFGRRLGGFQAMLEQIFAAMSQFVKTLSDSRTVTQEMPRPTPQRRKDSRYPLTARVQLRCDSWRTPHEAITQDVSAGGVFVITRERARVGEGVALSIDAGGARVELRGVVVSARNGTEAERIGRRPGVGIRWQHGAADVDHRIRMLVALAQQMAPSAASEPPSPRRRLARGTVGGSAQGPRRGVEPILGIDLGTTNTSVAAACGERVHVLPWPGGALAIPSAVAFPEAGRVVVGEEARRRLLRDPRHVVAAAKRLIGRSADDRELAPHLAASELELSDGPDGNLTVGMHGESYAVPQICAYLLAAARRTAEASLGRPVHRAVLTVPVSFSDERVELLRRAGRLAHLEVVQVIEEPAAAALANRQSDGFGGLIGVYDFGGGTFDFSVVDASGGDFEVLTTTGDSWLGGDDFDLAVANAAADLFWRAHQIDLRQRAVEWQALLSSCESAKRTLSSDTAAQIVVPEAMRTAEGAFDLRIRLSRDKVEPLWQPAIERSIHTCVHTLALLGLRPGDLSAIYLSGGTSHVPAVRRALARRFGVPIRVGVPPEHAVVLGAGVLAAQLERAIPPTLGGR